VLWHCWLGVRIVSGGCWHGYLSGARCKWFAYGPADATATPSSLAWLKSRMVLPFWFRLTQVVREKRPLNSYSSSSPLMLEHCALQVVRSQEPEFLAIHCQEVGGKNYEDTMQHVNKFIKWVLSALLAQCGVDGHWSVLWTCTLCHCGHWWVVWPKLTKWPVWIIILPNI